MPQGDAQRQWFPEMIDLLRQQWKPEHTWDELVILAAQLDRMLQGIRAERNILPPMFRCPCCDTYQRAKVQRISVNASILAAGRFGICSEIEAKELSKRWSKQRKTQNLDHFGNKADTTNP